MSSPKPYQYANELIPSVIPLLSTTEQTLLSESYLDPSLDRYHNLINSWKVVRQQMTLLEPELSSFCSEEWSHLNQVDEGLVCSHTFAALATVYSLPCFKSLDSHDQNIIIYGLLFHDIAKRGPPQIQTKDPVHPFTSAAKALRIFNNLGWVVNPGIVNEAADFIHNASFFHQWGNFMDNRKLPQIYRYLLYATGLLETLSTPYQTYSHLTKDLQKESLFIFEILAIILFHQSIDFNPEFPNFTPLKDLEVTKYLSPRLLDLLAVLVIGDSGSYYLPEPRTDWTFYRTIIDTSNELKIRCLGLRRSKK